MPHLSDQQESDSLLPSTPKLRNYSAPAEPSSTTRAAYNALAAIRIATGVACIVAPRFTCGLFRYSLPTEHGLIVRMFGIRDAVFGELLITAEDKRLADGGRREMKRAVWAGLAADVVDVGSIVLGVAMGQIGKTPGVLLGGAALGGIALGSVCLKGL